MEKLRVGVVGAGAISDIYLQNMTSVFSNLEVVSICAAHLERAKKQAEKYHLRAYTFEEMLADPEVDLVVNLTPVGVHYELVKKALESLEGVEQATASHEAKNAVVTLSKEVDTDVLKKAVEEAGYEFKGIE
jgi:copper chaperone CopZ